MDAPFLWGVGLQFASKILLSLTAQSCVVL